VRWSLHSKLLSPRQTGLTVSFMPDLRGQTAYLILLAMQPLHTPDSAQRKSKPISSRPRTMCLSCEPRGSTCARRLQEASRLCRKAQVSFTQMQLSRIVITPIAVFVLLALCSMRRVRNRGRDCDLRCDLLERRLRVGKSKLMAEEGGFGGIAVRGGDVEGLGGIYERLGLLHKAGEVEHCSWYFCCVAAVAEVEAEAEVLCLWGFSSQCDVIPPRR